MARTLRGRAATTAILGGLVSGVFLACSPEHAPDAHSAHARVVLDLALDFRFAEAQRELEVIDFGTEDAAVLLDDGWADNSRQASQVWSVGDSSSLEFFSSTLDERTLVARGEPFHFRGAPLQRVELAVNGTSRGEVELAPGVREVSWTIPSEVLRVGRNRLTFSYAYRRTPLEVIPGSQDPRSLAVSWQWLRFEGAQSGAAPSLGPEAQLVLPFRSQIDYFLLLPEKSVLELDSITLPSGTTAEQRDAALVVEVEQDLSGAITEHHLALSTEPQRLALDDSGGIVRLSLRALPGASPVAGGSSGLQVTAARVIAPASSKPVLDAPKSGAALGRPNVLLVVVDALRADALGVYGARPSPSPRIDAFAHEAILFSHSRANASWTRPGVASLLTGLTPWQHGVQETTDGLSPSVETLAEILQRAGYATAGFITNGNINREFGFAQGFDDYVALPEDPETRSLHRDAADLRKAATSWLAERTDERPFFLYLHASDPHAPYAPPSPHRERFVSPHAPALETMEYVREISRMTRSIEAGTAPQLRALYQAEVAHADEQFGLILDEFESRALLDDTIVVLTSDHGEEFYEHRWWQHGKTLYDEQLRIPLIIKLQSGRTRARSDRRVEQIDLLPTLLAQVDLPVPDGLTGQDALSDEWHDRPALALLNRDGRHVESVIDGGFKLIDTHAYAHPLGLSPGVQLFDLDRDPAEQHNLAPQRPVRVGHLRTVMRRTKAGASTREEPETIEIDAQTERTLRALGYIE